MKKILTNVRIFLKKRKERAKKDALIRDNIRVSEEQMLYSEAPGEWWQEQ